MKTTKTFRLLAVLLALVLAFGAMPALAVEIDSGDYAAWTQSAVDDLYGRLMAAENYEDYIAIVETLSETARTAFFNVLTEEQQAALEEHAIALTPASEAFEPIVRFTKVGPLLPAPASGARMMRFAARNGGSSGSDSGIVLNKTAVKDGDGYKITLEAYATGKITTTVSTEPVDIVLVLDVSGSMDDPMSTSTEYKAVYSNELKNNTEYYIWLEGQYTRVYRGAISGEWFYGRLNYVQPKTSETDSNVNHVQFYEKVTSSTKRIDSLKSAVNGFIDNVADKSPDSSIAIVKFAGNKSSKVGNDTYQDGRWTYNYSQTVKKLTSVKNNTDTLKSAVNSLRPAGATRSDYGMKLAQSIITGEESKNKKKVVIMFTDGAPTSENEFEEDVANSAISASKSIKDAGATVYTIGIFSGANGTPVNSLNGLSQENKYMHLVSSNYKNAISMTSPGTATYPGDDKSYFLSAKTSGDLSSIFTQISQEVGGSKTQLDATSVIKDVVTPYFDMPENASEVKVYTEDSNGDTSTWINKAELANANIELDPTNNTVSVSGFSFKDNWCGNHTDGNGNTTFHDGKKLVIEFTVTAKEKFLGGNGVVTNGTNSGIYDGAGNLVEEFELPKVDVTIKDPTITLPDANVYLGAYFDETVSADDLKNGTSISFDNGKITLDLNKADDKEKPWGLEPWQTEYVDITVTVKDKDGNKVTDFENLREDTDYTVSVSIQPKATGTQTGYNKPSSGTIHVFTPELTFKDNTVDYQSSLDDYAYAEKDYVGTKWRHQDADDANVRYSTEDGVTMLGSQIAPTLTLGYEPTEGVDTNNKVTATDYVPVKVTVKIGNDDVTQYTTFVHQPCTDAALNCQWATVTKISNGNPAFLLHVKGVYADLTITKSGAENVDKDQSFLFTVTGPDNYSTEVIIVGNKSVTLKNLKIGEYTVTENTNWSWRYKPEKVSEPITLKANEKNEVTINNTRDEDQWLDGNVHTDNKFTGAAATTD